MGSELARLRAFLTGIPSGDINLEHERELETLLGGCWDELVIADTGGMNPQKLFSRMENISWHHPTLQFEIERHGAVHVFHSPKGLSRLVADAAAVTAVVL